MRIISLLPGATEIVAALGAADALVGVSHECDFPSFVRRLPKVTTTPIDIHQSSRAIDTAVRGAVAAGRRVIAVDADLLRTLRPSVVISQTLCDVCAVSDGEVHALSSVLDPAPMVVSMTGTTLEGVWEDIAAIGAAIDRAAAARALTTELRATVERYASTFTRSDPLRVIVIEWLDPLFLAGHWMPEVIAAAGGIDIGAKPGDHSHEHSWSAVMNLNPDVVVVALCGFDESRARQELLDLQMPEVLDWLGSRPVLIIDGNALTSRAGPRLVEAIERIGTFIRRVTPAGP